MEIHKRLMTVAIVMAATVGWAAEDAKEPPPTWPWPGPTPPEIRDALVIKRNIFRPTEQDLKKMETSAPDKPVAAPAKPRKLLCWGRLWTHLCNPFTEAAVQILGRKNDYPISWVKPYGRGRVFYCSLGVQKPPYSNPRFLQYLLAGIQFALGDLPADTTPSEQ